MMTRETLVPMWDHLRLCHGIALRAVEAIPGDRLDSRPIPDMRTPKELVVHLYGTMVRDCAVGVLHGEMTEDESRGEAATAARLETRDDLLGFCAECWAAADEAVALLTDERLAAPVKTPWGMNPPGHFLIGALYDEFFHHRGQLYAYLRALGVAPPDIYDFEHNAPEFRQTAPVA